VLRDALLGRIEGRRVGAGIPEALIDISEAVRSAVSGVDAVADTAEPGEDLPASLRTLGTKRAARELAGMKTGSIGANAAGKRQRPTSTHRDKSTIGESFPRTGARGTGVVTFESDLKHAILVALGRR